MALIRSISRAGRPIASGNELARPPLSRSNLTARTVDVGRQALGGKVQGWRAALPFAGPAVITSVAYIDPGNFATNLQAGALCNYDLLSIVLLASLIAMFLQSQSAKLGIVTGRNLAELSRDHFPRRLVWIMWGATELAAMATDLAEFLGSAIGLSWLLSLSLLSSMLLNGFAVFLILALQNRGFRPLELVIFSLVGTVIISYMLEVFLAMPSWIQVGSHLLVPTFTHSNSLTLAVGIVGATVMPHAIYLHSGLVQKRIVPQNLSERRKLLQFSNREVIIALTTAGFVNLAMVITFARAFYDHQSGAVLNLQTAYRAFIPLLGEGAAVIFMLSLVASGISSSTVGTMAGQMVMQGFVDFHIPLWVRRSFTMIPAFAVLGMSVNPTEALVLSQVVLSLVLPVPMISLLILTSKPALMKSFVNGRLASTFAIVATTLIIALNGALLLNLMGVCFG